MTIFDINARLLELYDIIEENEGEIPSDILEELTITEEDFKNKIKSYTEIIKKIKSDVVLINSEIDRLKSLKQSKERGIDNIEKLITLALNKFGDTTKSGSKFIDYGTGKVSVRTSQSVETDDDNLIADVNSVIVNILNIAENNQLDCYDGINLHDITPVCDTYDEPYKLDISDTDADNIKVKITLDTTLSELSKGDKFKAMGKLLLQYSNTKVDAKMDKTSIKNILKENPTGSDYAKLIYNQSITIK